MNLFTKNTVNKNCINYDIFIKVLESIDIPSPVREFKFHKTRRWRFDFCWPEYKLALEVDGGAFNNGRHTRGKGFIADMDKYNAAALLGWTVLRTTPHRITNGDAALLIEKFFIERF